MDDVLDALGENASSPAELTAAPASLPTRPAPSNLTPVQQKLWDHISSEPVQADVLVQQSGLAVTEVGTALILMEMQGHIRRLPGNRFERK